MNETALFALQHHSAILFASVLLVIVVFLIARVAHVGQARALALALTPMALTLLLERAPAMLLG
jgi:hypothetical protein